jgi:hypothetical protein
VDAGGTDEAARRAALAWAATCRDRWSALEAALGAGEVDLAGALGPGTTEDHQLGLVKVLVVLEALPGARKVDTRRALAGLGVDETTPVRDLSPEQRDRLLATFPLPARGAA